MAKLLERKKNRQIKGLISHMWLILYHTVQPVMPDICTNFQNPRSFDENFHIHYIGVIEKGKNKKRRRK